MQIKTELILEKEDIREMVKDFANKKGYEINSYVFKASNDKDGFLNMVAINVEKLSDKNDWRTNKRVEKVR